MRPRSSVRSLLRRFFRSLVKLYFRHIEVVGETPKRSLGGRVFVSNHVNALIDPILVLTHVPCDVSPLAKSTLWKMPGLRWLLDTADAVPVVRRRDDPNKAAGSNDEMFSKVSRHLSEGGNILVFPEGTSHNEPHMLRLKTGAARMLAQARREGGAAGLSYQAVGLEFDARAMFRSSAVVAYGPVRAVESTPEDEDAFVEVVTKRMADDLAIMVVEGATWDDRRLILRVAELFRNEGDKQGFAASVELAQQVETAQALLLAKDPARIDAVRIAVDRYFDELAKFGMTDEIFVTDDATTTPLSTRLLLAVLLPLSPIGLLLYFLPYQLPRMVAGRSEEVDQHSTLKLGTGLLAYPVWAGILIGIAAWLWSSALGTFLVMVLIIVLSPFAALVWTEHANDLFRPILGAFSPARLARLAKLRAAALTELSLAREAIESSAPSSSKSVSVDAEQSSQLRSD